MAYLGQQPVVGRYILLDQISGGFNGTASGFTMSTAAGAQGVIPGLAQNVLLSLGGVIQQPGVDYTISGSGLTFTTPPVSGTTFFATVLGDAQSVGTPSDGTVTPASIASGYDFVFPNLSVTGVHTIASGSAAVPSLTITGDTDTGLFSPGANQIAVTTSGSTAVTISGSNVGIGTTSPAVAFEVQSASNTTIRIDNEDDSTAQLYFHNTGSTDMDISVSGANMTFNQGGNERVRIDSSGRLLVGAESFTGSSKLVVRGNSSAATGGANFYLVRGESSADMSNSDVVGIIRFGDQDDNRSAQIRSLIDGTPSATSMPGNLSFWTTEAGDVVPTERMTIDSSGNVGIGETTPGELLSLHQAVDTEANLLSLRGSSFGDGEKIFATFKRGSVNLARVGVEAAGAGQAGHLIFETASSGTPTEHVRIDSSGRLLVGIADAVATDADSKLQLVSTGNPKFIIARNDTSVSSGQSVGDIVWYGNDADGTYEQCALVRAAADADHGTGDKPTRLMFYTTGASSSTPSARMTIDSDGSVGIGTTAPETRLHLRGALGPVIRIENTDTSIVGNDSFGGLEFESNDSSAGSSGVIGKIECIAQNTFDGTSTNGTAVRFFTATINPLTLTERLRITPRGYTKHTNSGTFININGLYHEYRNDEENSVALRVYHAGATSGTQYGIRVDTDDDQNDSTRYFLQCAGSTTNRARINSDGGLANYQSNDIDLSDEREKKNIEPLDSTWACLKNWELKKYHYNEDADTDNKRYGVIAQQVAEHCPEVIADWIKQEAAEAVLDEDGNVVAPAVEEIVRMGVKEQQMMWMAIKALQEAQTRIEQLEANNVSLEARLAALEAN